MRFVILTVSLALAFMVLGVNSASADIVCFPWAHTVNKTLTAAYAEGEQLCEGEPFNGQGLHMMLQVKKHVRFWPDPWVTVHYHKEWIWKKTFVLHRSIGKLCTNRTLTTWRSVVHGKVKKLDGSVLGGYDVSPGHDIRCGATLP